MNFSDDDFAPPVEKDWSYNTPEVLKLVILKYASPERAEQLIAEADLAVAQKRAELGGQKVHQADFAGTKWNPTFGAASPEKNWTIQYVLELQKS